MKLEKEKPCSDELGQFKRSKKYYTKSLLQSQTLLEKVYELENLNYEEALELSRRNSETEYLKFLNGYLKKVGSYEQN